MRSLLLVISILVLSMNSGTGAFATSVDVYAEGGYTDSYLIIKIFADINTNQMDGPLRSAGVKLTYPSDKLLNPLALKNEKDWYLGAPNMLYPYKDPDISTRGEIIFLLGILDVNSPTDGVDGKRILLGSIVFDRQQGTAVPLANEFHLAQGEEPPFVDFATTLGHELDDTVVFLSPTIHSLDHLNLTGIIRILRILTNLENDVPVRPVEFDANNDEVIGLEEAIDLLRAIAD